MPGSSHPQACPFGTLRLLRCGLPMKASGPSVGSCERGPAILSGRYLVEHSLHDVADIVLGNAYVRNTSEDVAQTCQIA